MKSRSRLCSSTSLKHEFLKRWIKGLHVCRNLNKDTSISNRKNAIKLSADIAIASTRKATTNWSRAVVNDVVSRDSKSRILVEQIVGHKVEKRALITCSRRILRRSHSARGRVVPVKELVKNRTRVLKRLVPGGEELSGISLIKETLDYIVSLRVQVDVMRRLAQSFDPSSKHLEL